MRLVDFLILLLDSHAQTLKRLAALYGEDVLVEILEASGEEPKERFKINPAWFENAPHATFVSSAPYQELEGFVRDLKLPAMLEFHLWAYPHYRAFIESSLDLNARLQMSRSSDEDARLTLVDSAVAQAEAWVKQLHIPPELSAQTERAAQVPWLRFRAEALKRIGMRPMGSVS